MTRARPLVAGQAHFEGQELWSWIQRVVVQPRSRPHGSAAIRAVVRAQLEELLAAPAITLDQAEITRLNTAADELT